MTVAASSGTHVEREATTPMPLRGLAASAAIQGVANGLRSVTTAPDAPLSRASTPSKYPTFLVIDALDSGTLAPLRRGLTLDLASVGLACAGLALGLVMLVGQRGGSLPPNVSGAMAQSSGFLAALAVLAVAHLLVVLPALGHRSRQR